MGAYTYTDNPMGITLTPRLKKILKLYNSGEDISREDIGYLIDESAKYTTIETRISSDKYKIKDSMLSEEYDLKEVIGDLFTELDLVYASQINEERIYKHDIDSFGMLHGTLQTLSEAEIKNEVRSAINTVKELQKSFDANGDGLKVVGTFKYLKKEYNFKMEVTDETKQDDVLKEIVTQILPKAEVEAVKKQKMVDRLSKLSEEYEINFKQ